MSPDRSIAIAFLLAGAPVALAVIGILVRLLIRRSTRRRAARERRVEERRVEGRRCPCGYRLVGLALPRCPECGRAVGFDKTFEELGLTEEELRRLRERAAQQPPPPPVPSV